MPALRIDSVVTAASLRGLVLMPPSDPSSVGWWRGGRAPGARDGHVVLVGHTVHTGGGVFDRLGRLRTGDRITVRSGPDHTTYAVLRIAVWRKGTLAHRAGAVFARTGAPRLVLVTCTGWTGSGYRSSVVVTARPLSR